MNKKLWIGLLTLLLSFSMLLVGCSKTENTPADTTDNTNTVATDDGLVKDQIPDSLNYGGEEISVLNWASEVIEFGTSYNSELVNDACYERNLAVQDRLKISLKFREEPGGPENGQVSSFCALVQNASAAGDYYDLVVAYGRAAATLSYQGYLADMLNIDGSYLNFENPWWSSGLMDELSVGGSLYLASGDISPSVVQLSQGIFYNVDMMKDYRLTDPYEHVKNNTWTLDTFYTYLQSIAAPDSGIGYAFVSNYYNIASLFHGCGVRLMVRDNEGWPQMNPDLYGEKAVTIMTRFGEWASADNFLVASDDDSTFEPFYSGNALFVNASINASKVWSQRATFNYSVVPVPKYDENQDNYYTTLHNSITVYSLMRGQTQSELVKESAILECMASEGYRRITPAVYKTCLLSRYASVEYMPEMLELIHSTVNYDFGRIYSMQQTNYLCDRIGRIIQQDPNRSEYGKTWNSFGESEGPRTEAQFNKIIDNLKALA